MRIPSMVRGGDGERQAEREGEGRGDGGVAGTANVMLHEDVDGETGQDVDEVREDDGLQSEP